MVSQLPELSSLKPTAIFLILGNQLGIATDLRLGSSSTAARPVVTTSTFEYNEHIRALVRRPEKLQARAGIKDLIT